MDEQLSADLKLWLEQGGVLIAISGAAKWVADKEIVKASFTEVEKLEKPQRLAYGERRRDFALESLNGVILAVDLDLSHPLAFGLSSARLDLFRNHRLRMELDTNPYATVGQYPQTDLLVSGYASKKNQERLAGSASLIVQKRGAGTVVLMMEPPDFRGYWLGAHKLLFNGLFFGGIVE